MARQVVLAHAQRGGTLLGVVIGFALGVTVAGLIAFALTKSSNPFDGKMGRIVDPSAPQAGSDRDARTGERKFDFSKILPGVVGRRSQESSTDKTPVAAPATAAPSSLPSPALAQASAMEKGKYYLQAGAYQNVADAEDQRAKLALMGIEASLQPISVPDRGTLNRVRLGPYGSAEEMNSIKTELMKRGIPTAVIKGQ